VTQKIAGIALLAVAATFGSRIPDALHHPAPMPRLETAIRMQAPPKPGMPAIVPEPVSFLTFATTNPISLPFTYLGLTTVFGMSGLTLLLARPR
jgi:hypothetical protein